MAEADSMPVEVAPPDDKVISMEESSSASDDDDLKKGQGVVEVAEGVEVAEIIEFPMRETKVPLWGGAVMNFNWLTSFIGIVLLWGSVTFCLVNTEQAQVVFAEWKSAGTLLFSWLFIGTRPLWMFFVAFLCFRYGSVRLGAHKDVRPEFSNMTYFTMIFSAGVAVGLFFFGVSEPLWHQSSHRFSNAGYRTEDEIDQYALNLTLFHWGFGAWVSYVLVGIVTGVGSYRFGLPFTIRSTLYPLLGEYTWGWIGDFLDGFTIWVTVAGVCTSLGLGASQIVAGLQRLGAVDPSLVGDELVTPQVITIVIITLIATISVVSGLDVGIKILSQIGFGFGMLLLFLVLVLDSTKFLFNLIVQSTGYYFQWSILELNFFTDAFAQLRPGEGRATDGLSAEVWWIDAWTVFYMAWWTAWSGFVGVFIARISKGRTVSEVVLYNMLAPLMYSIIWFCVFGGVGLRQARQAMELEVLGETAFGDPQYFVTEERDYCYNVPQQDVTFPQNDTVIFTNYLPGVTPVCKFNSAESTQAWFNVMYSYSFPTEGNPDVFGSFMAGLSVVAVIIYFTTSSDSASMVVDQFASNGRTSHHWLQRVFWAFTEGAVACALLVAGGANALNALQAASVIAGLPFSFVVMYQCQALWIMLDCAEKADNAENGETDALVHLNNYVDASFKMPVWGGIFNLMEYLVSFGRVHEDRIAKNMDLPQGSQVKEFLIGLLMPFWSIYRIRNYLDGKGSRKRGTMLVAGSTFAFFIGWIALFACQAINPGYKAFGWTLFFCFALVLLNVRSEVRSRFNVKGNVVEDFFASSFCYPQTLAQMIYEFENNTSPVEGGDGDGDDVSPDAGKMN